jgi:hypothetical protein
MIRRLIAILVVVWVFAAGIIPACTVLPRATVYVADESGRPIPHAQINPFPFDHGTNVSNSQGKANLFKLENAPDYAVEATGYYGKDILFPGEGKTIIVILKRDPHDEQFWLNHKFW